MKDIIINANVVPNFLNEVLKFKYANDTTSDSNKKRRIHGEQELK